MSRRHASQQVERWAPTAVAVVVACTPVTALLTALGMAAGGFLMHRPDLAAGGSLAGAAGLIAERCHTRSVRRRLRRERVRFRAESQTMRLSLDQTRRHLESAMQALLMIPPSAMAHVNAAPAEPSPAVVSGQVPASLFTPGVLVAPAAQVAAQFTSAADRLLAHITAIKVATAGRPGVSLFTPAGPRVPLTGISALPPGPAMPMSGRVQLSGGVQLSGRVQLSGGVPMYDQVPAPTVWLPPMRPVARTRVTQDAAHPAMSSAPLAAGPVDTLSLPIIAGPHDAQVAEQRVLVAAVGPGRR